MIAVVRPSLEQVEPTYEHNGLCRGDGGDRAVVDLKQSPFFVLLDLVCPPRSTIPLAADAFAPEPCTFGFMFPVLAVVFRAAEQSLPQAIAIVLSYAIGHSLVIVLAGVGVNQLQTFLNWDSKARGTLWLKRLCGVLIILTGLYLAFGRLVA